jgi:FixJ family two-component response regulator
MEGVAIMKSTEYGRFPVGVDDAGGACAGIAEARAAPALSPIPAPKHTPHALSDILATLTSLERQIFDRIMLGRANETISDELHISQEAVDSHCSDLMVKLRTHNAALRTRAMLTKS